ncbi:hypothetical protein [Orenia marismortui]|uniref:hypothetical protein n=1 Tax=Orenia marismortui TaxID=46469 RepID=UPI0003702979|nr:hypothetical protein [Orenia marismortui]
MDKKKIIKKLIPFVIAIEVIFFSDSLQKFGLGIIVGALLVEVLNLRLDRTKFKAKTEKSPLKDLEDIKLSEASISYNKGIIEFIEELKLQFSDLTSSKYYKESARLALNQLLRLIDKFEKFKNILDIKLDKEEITYERFMSVTEEVYYNILDNLEKIKNIYQSIEDVNLGYINFRIDMLENKADLTTEMREELISLQKRKGMILGELDSIDRYLSINEKAMTDIDNMKIKLGRVKTSSSQAKKEFDLSIADLQKMANRINQYEYKGNL